jgi:hypothetical protein
MNDWIKTIMGLAPTVATALGTPLAGVAIAAIGNVLGMSEPTTDKIAKAFADGQIRPEDMVKIKQLEIEFKTHESEMGYKYADLAFKQDALAVGDRADARKANVSGGAQMPLFYLSLVLLIVTLGCEIAVLFLGYPATTSEMVVGRILGLMDAVTMMVLVYWYGSNKDSARKTEMLANSAPLK